MYPGSFKLGPSPSSSLGADQLIQTSDFCDRTAVYRTMCCKFDVIVRQADAMPRCPCCRASTAWSLVRDLSVRSMVA